MQGFRFRLCLLLPIVVLAISVPTLVDAAVRYRPSRLQVAREKMSPDAKRDEILADLDTMTGSGAGWDQIATKPYLSNRGGLCRRDVITLSYTGNKPVGFLSVEQEYYYLGEQDTRTMAEWTKACERLNGGKTYWTRSGGDADFTYNAFVMLQIAASAVRGEGDTKANCVVKDIDEPDFKCGPEFLKAMTKLAGVRRCNEQRRDCDAFSFDQYKADITLKCDKVCTISIEMGTNDDDIIIT